MKRRLKKSTLLLVLLAGLVFIGCVNAVLINIGGFDETIDSHKVRLHKLFLWDSDYSGSIVLSNDWNTLKFSTWLIVWSDNTIDLRAEASFIWWWDNNKINVMVVTPIGIFWGISWIWWWSNNQVNWKNSVIWWWSGNSSSHVVLWWYKNTSNSEWVVVWWWFTWNIAASRGVVLWWYNNNSNALTFTMWGNSLTCPLSFSWHGTCPSWLSSSALIKGSWALIWMDEDGWYIEDVVVVSWAVKIPSWLSLEEEWEAWEIKYYSWCFYVNNGDSWYVINRWNHDECPDVIDESKYCTFGNMLLPVWATMSGGYNVPLSNNCDGEKWSVKCVEGVEGWELNWAIYPYCYNLTY